MDLSKHEQIEKSRLVTSKHLKNFPPAAGNLSGPDYATWALTRDLNFSPAADPAMMLKVKSTSGALMTLKTPQKLCFQMLLFIFCNKVMIFPRSTVVFLALCVDKNHTSELSEMDLILLL